ncbi:MAG: alpha-amylase family glycosyl hydrolase [Pseudomonadota bacterium]
MTRIGPFVCGLVFALAAAACAVAVPSTSPAKTALNKDISSQSTPPIFYHIFVRSFSDSDGDREGDLRGIIDKLDYLQSLGVTGILLTPLYPSQFYHNYFADDFYGIDPEFGDMQDYQDLVAELHRRDMVIYLDQEIQYVSGHHEWFTSSFRNPLSPFRDFVVYADGTNTAPVATLFGKTEFDVWPAQKQDIYTVNMLDAGVRDYFTEYLLFWMDPNGDGDFSDGVDGYRIDHMMDDLDNAGVLTGLFQDFWRPIFDELRAKRPDIDIIAEQYDWGYGEQFLGAGGADKVFGFPVWKSVNDLDANALAEAVETTNLIMTKGKGQFVFIENHDTNRFAHAYADQLEIQKLGAAVNLLIGWTPIIYYGQEIGMTGAKVEGLEAEALSASADDARDIPVRQAFRWSPDPTSSGHATWYREPALAYPIIDSNIAGDGRSVAEQDQDPGSLLSYYRDLSALRTAYPALATGRTSIVSRSKAMVVIERRYEHETPIIVAFNFSSSQTKLTLPPEMSLGRKLLGEEDTQEAFGVAQLPAFSATVWEILE